MSIALVLTSLAPVAVPAALARLIPPCRTNAWRLLEAYTLAAVLGVASGAGLRGWVVEAFVRLTALAALVYAAQRSFGSVTTPIPDPARQHAAAEPVVPVAAFAVGLLVHPLGPDPLNLAFVPLFGMVPRRFAVVAALALLWLVAFRLVS